jgi:hypothetical protein
MTNYIILFYEIFRTHKFLDSKHKFTSARSSGEVGIGRHSQGYDDIFLLDDENV